MKSVWLTALFVSGAMALPAMAQDADTADLMGVEAPSVSETDTPEPEWYRQFTLAGPSDELGENPAIQSAPDKDVRFQLIDGTRWKFSIDLTSRPEDSPLPREEMSAGATFQLTPRLSVGGDVSIGANELDDSANWTDEEMEAGIRLRSAFRF